MVCRLYIDKNCLILVFRGKITTQNYPGNYPGNKNYPKSGNASGQTILLYSEFGSLGHLECTILQSYLEVGEGSGPKSLHQLRISPTFKQPSFKFWPPGYARKIDALVSESHSKLMIGNVAKQSLFNCLGVIFMVFETFLTNLRQKSIHF